MFRCIHFIRYDFIGSLINDISFEIGSIYTRNCDVYCIIVFFAFVMYVSK